MSEQPWTFAQAREKALDAEAAQEKAEKALRDAWEAYAEAERAYKEALALKSAEAIAELRELRDIALGVREAADKQPVHGRGVPPNVDPHTGEMRSAA